MKQVVILFVLLFVSGISTVLAQSNEVKVRVDGLSCPFCAYTLEKKLYELNGVDSLSIDYEEGLVFMLVMNPDDIQIEDIKTKIEEAGFTFRKAEYPQDE